MSRDSIAEDLKRLAKRPHKLFSGYLAEEYDGIGRYVLISLAGGSTSAAYRAEVGAGDFGGGRVFPPGTPVVLHSFHGRLRILTLGNLPGCPVDEFDRTVAPASGDSWGEGRLGIWYPPEPESPAGVYVQDGTAFINFDWPDFYNDYNNDPSAGIQLDDSEWISVNDGDYEGIPSNVTIEIKFRCTPVTGRYGGNPALTINFYLSALWGVNSVGFDDWIAYVVQNEYDPYDQHARVYINHHFWSDVYLITEKGDETGNYFPIAVEDAYGKILNAKIKFTNEGKKTEWTVWEDGTPEPSEPSYWATYNEFPHRLRFFVIELLDEALLEVFSVKICGLKLPVRDTIAPNNYEGDVYAMYLGSGSGSWGYGYWIFTADNPGAGWVNIPRRGPIVYDQSSAPFYSFTVSEDMIVRLQARAHWAGVVTNYTLTLSIKVNNVTIGSDVQSHSGGLGYWAPQLDVDLRNVQLRKGDIVSGVGTPADGGWGNFGLNNTFLICGRGHITGTGWDWTGP